MKKIIIGLFAIAALSVSCVANKTTETNDSTEVSIVDTIAVDTTSVDVAITVDSLQK